MNKQSWLLNLSLLKTHPAFRAVFLARFISIVSLGLLGVAVPVQIQMMTHSTWQVGLSVTPGHLTWYFGEELKKMGMNIINDDITGRVHKDRKLLTGDSPFAANALGKLAAQEMLAAYAG